MARTIIISNNPTAARQRLADPSDQPSGRVNLADADHLVVAEARVASVDDGYVELADLEPLQSNDRFYIWAATTIFAYTPTSGTRKVEPRPDQDAFRATLLAAYGRRCAVTGCDVPELLDAAHLVPWRISSDPKDGVLLRTDLHRMIDRGLARIEDGKFVLTTPVTGYQHLDGTRLRRRKRSDP